MALGQAFPCDTRSEPGDCQGWLFADRTEDPAKDALDQRDVRAEV